MIDIHCHILPHLDDGAQSIEESLAMAKVAMDEGITSVVATPHRIIGRYENTSEIVREKVDEVNRLLNERGLDLTVLPGMECRITGEILEDYDKAELLTLADSKYLFIELPSSSVPRYTKDLLYDIQLHGLVPIIVHPERNQQLIEKPDILYDLVKHGTLTQITAASLTGKFGKKIKTFTEEIIEANLTHFIASDAHNTTNRNFHLTAAYDTLQNEFGESMVYFYKENAELLIKNEHVMIEPPNRITRRKKLFGLF